MKTRLPFPGLREALLWAVLSFPGLLVAQNRPQLAPEEQAHYHHDGCGREHGHPRLDGFGKELLQSVGPLEGHIPAVQRFAARTSATCTSGNAGWASLSSSALVAELKSVDDYQACFAVWYSWDASYSPSIFSTANITAVAQEMYNISIASDGTFNGGMYGLVTYLHAAVYHEFYQPVVTLDANAQYWLRIACESFANNSHLWDLTSEAIAILDEYLIIIDYDGIRSRPAIINVIESALDRLTNQQTWSAIQNDQQLMQDYARTYNRPFFAIFRGNQDADFKEALNGDSSFWTVLQQTGVSTTLRNNGNLSFMTDNAILELTRMANEPTLIDDIESLIAAAAGQFARLDVNWLRCVEAINDYGNCASYGLCEDPEALEAELKAFLFPNQYSFDDGLMQISTPLAEDEVQELYHAAKQVQNQFFRLLQTDEPVMGDVNDTLNMIVFGSKSQYDAYANYLYGISTNNGGIYIERWSTFFTWDRTVGVESSLSLESLFRHEYVHYLQGRYLIPGYWGETTMYQNSRMVWYEEGMAELFAGSTDTDGVNLLASNVNTVTNAAPNWPTLSTVFNSNYSSGNFNHYYYGNMAWYHWYQNDFGQLKTFFDLTRADDVTGFDNLVNNLRTSGTSSFNTFLSKVSNGEVPGWEPTTEWKADDQLAVADLAGVENEFTALTGITPASVGFETQSLNRRFQITGTVSGSQAAGNNTDAAQQINEALDNILTDMRSNPFLSNFDYSVGYFTDLDYSGAVPTATFVISGPLRDPNVSASPVADFTGAPTVTVAGGTVQFQNTSTGYLSGLSWSFPGATSTTGTTGQTPTATYANPGTYSVSLTANGAEGSSDTETKNGYIEVYPVSTQNYCAASADLDYNYVSRVQLGTINNTSGWDSYGDYRNSLAVLSLGNAETLTVNLDVESWEYNAVGAWIDWNQDGDFEDAGEEVLRVYGAGPYVASITPPAGATLGTTAMRIRIGYGSEDKITPCGVDTYMGDVEDYSIRVNDQAQPTPPVANFTASTTSILTGESINFTDLTSNSPTSWSWTFAGGSPASSSAQNPTIAYNSAGTYEVSLTATNADGSDTKTVSSYITVSDPVPTPPIANFTANATSILTGESVTFSDLSTNSPTGW
ncbi:MAG TPA: hypothetical protein DCP28_32180, partial [Cytophagales bacterium]|nr:hypothetical protein [Cytophagales bacterium]